jgi:hypothetical protein
MISMNKVFADLPVTIFEAMSQAARSVAPPPMPA